MLHLCSLDNLHLTNAWVTIGSFDGVHIGHRSIIQDMVREAHTQNAPAVVITFFPHPSVVLRNNLSLGYLTMPDERAELLAELGIDYVITLEFTPALANLTATEFFLMLSQGIHLKQLWVGHDFTLGKNREGNVARLKELGSQMGFSVHVVSPLMHAGHPVSSSRIRTLLAEGNVEQAARMLGYFYALSGTVVIGDQRGHTLGFPTANLQPPPQRLIPAYGIYACWANVAGQQYRSVTNIGVRPTFEPSLNTPRVETFILDFNQNIYNQPLKIQFVKFLRPEQRYPSQQALIEQINLDIEQSREVLKHAPSTSSIPA